MAFVEELVSEATKPEAAKPAQDGLFIICSSFFPPISGVEQPMRRCLA